MQCNKIPCLHLFISPTWLDPVGLELELRGEQEQKQEQKHGPSRGLGSPTRQGVASLQLKYLLRCDYDLS